LTRLSVSVLTNADSSLRKIKELMTINGGDKILIFEISLKLIIANLFFEILLLSTPT